jgi:hypothetical protein
MHIDLKSKAHIATRMLGLAGRTMIGNNSASGSWGMIVTILRISRGARYGFLFALFLIAGAAHPVKAGLSEAERITLDQPACAQMKSFSQDITLINDEMQNVRRSGQRRRLCDILARASTTIGSTVGYMQSHIGECTITSDSINNLALLGRQFEGDRRKLCRY